MRCIAAGDAYDDHIFHSQRSARHVASALPRIFDVDAPDFLAGFLIQRDQVIVGGPQEGEAMRHGQPAILLAVCDLPRIGRQLVAILP